MFSSGELLRLEKKQTWPSVCGVPAYAVDPRLQWRAGLAAASLAQSAACAGRHRSVEIQNKYRQQVRTVSLRGVCLSVGLCHFLENHF